MSLANIKKYSTLRIAFLSILISLFLYTSYILLEPMVAVGQSEEFVITQEITQDIAFTADPNDVVLLTNQSDPTSNEISGLTGGVSNGVSTFTIATNSPDGYTVRLRFDDAGSGNAMAYTNDPANFFISNGPPTPVFNLNLPASATPAIFAYTVSGSDAHERFRNNGTNCEAAAGTANGTNCFFMQSSITSNTAIFSSNAPTPGTTGNVHFRAAIGPDTDPVLPTGTYTATATLTAIVN